MRQAWVASCPYKGVEFAVVLSVGDWCSIVSTNSFVHSRYRIVRTYEHLQGTSSHNRRPAHSKAKSQDPGFWIPRLHCVPRGMTGLKSFFVQGYQSFLFFSNISDRDFPA